MGLAAARPIEILYCRYSAAFQVGTGFTEPTASGLKATKAELPCLAARNCPYNNEGLFSGRDRFRQRRIWWFV